MKTRREVIDTIVEIKRRDLPPAGGATWSKSLVLVLFQIFLMTALSSSLHWSILPAHRNKSVYNH